MLFEEVPYLVGEHVVLREMREDDAPALAALTESEEVYRFLPTFLYELQGADKRAVIAGMRAVCYDTHESIMLAVCPASDIGRMVGIAEVYHYQPERQKASIGCRLGETSWGEGIATETVALLKDYLTGPGGCKTITAHVMVGNGASAHVLEKNGFRASSAELWEDWGRSHPVEVVRYVFEV